MTVPRLQFERVAPGRVFHAAVVLARPGRGVAAHRHDFWELFAVNGGAGTHLVGGRAFPLTAGDLVLVRPEDEHAIEAAPDGQLHFVNVAIPDRAWRDFIAWAGLQGTLGQWLAVEGPPTVALSAERRGECAEAFRLALRAYAQSPDALALCRFLGAVLPLLGPGPAASEPAGPPWLSRALDRLREPEHLRAGVPRLLELSGVSATHLARVVRDIHGLTPTELVNERRLARAAELLTTTPAEVIEVASGCGFENLSHFYRLFKRRYGRPPGAFRLAARAAVAPYQPGGEN